MHRVKSSLMSLLTIVFHDLYSWLNFRISCQFCFILALQFINHSICNHSFMFIFSYKFSFDLCCVSCSFFHLQTHALNILLYHHQRFIFIIVSIMHFFIFSIVASNANNHSHQHPFSLLQCLIYYIPLLFNIKENSLQQHW
jgi:hypothetical protein